jgi:hypothetical protein
MCAHSTAALVDDADLGQRPGLFRLLRVVLGN